MDTATAPAYVSPVVLPETKTIDLSNGDKIIIKKKLNQGETRRQYARTYTTMVDGNLGVNPMQVGLAMVTAYLVDWTIRDHAGQVIAVRGKPIEEVEAALDALEPEVYDEIKEAIKRHERETLAARAAAKNGQDGEKKSSAILPSANDTAGDTSGSTSSIQTSIPS